MDFDEYEYLEQTVEKSESRKLNQTANADSETLKSKEKAHSRSSRNKSDDKDDKVDQNLKKSPSGDKIHDNDRHKEKGSARRRSRSRDNENGRQRSSRDRKDREEDRDRDRERDRDGDKRRRSGDKDREREHNRDRDRRERVSESERESERDRSRQSKSHSERLQSDRDGRETDRSRERERSRDNVYGDREKDWGLKDRDRDSSRRHKEKKEDVAEPEVDPERDQRTVFAYQLPLKADERDLYEFFSRAGKVRDVKLIMDRNSRRSKGVGYIEFYDVMSVPMAIALSGQPLLGQPVMVKPSEAEKNLVQSTASVTSGAGHSGGGRRLYVGNLLVNMTETDLRNVFEAFGEVELVQLPLNEAGLCKGFGFVQYARFEDARNALSLDGQLNIGGQTIKVSSVTDQSGTTQEVARNTGDLDDEEGGGLTLNASSRALLMQKLDRSGTISSVSGSLGTPVTTGINPLTPTLGAASMASIPAPPLVTVHGLVGQPGGPPQVPTAPGAAVILDVIGIPSECLLLKNMFDPKEEKDPDFDLDIKDDVQDECSRYGNVRHIFVDKNSAGHVYLQFDNAQSATSAQRALHGRWFAGKMITASFMVPQNYEAKFAGSR